MLAFISLTLQFMTKSSSFIAVGVAAMAAAGLGASIASADPRDISALTTAPDTGRTSWVGYDCTDDAIITSAQDIVSNALYCSQSGKWTTARRGVTSAYATTADDKSASYIVFRRGQAMTYLTLTEYGYTGSSQSAVIRSFVPVPKRELARARVRFVHNTSSDSGTVTCRSSSSGVTCSKDTTSTADVIVTVRDLAPAVTFSPAGDPVSTGTYFVGYWSASGTPGSDCEGINQPFFVAQGAWTSPGPVTILGTRGDC